MSVAEDTIAAISTPIGFGGIGIVRISGPECAFVVHKIFRKSLKKAAKKSEKHSENDFKGIYSSEIELRIYRRS